MSKYYSRSGCELTIDKNSEYVNFINKREDDAIYSFEVTRFANLLKKGGKQWKVPSKDTETGFITLTFNEERRHLSSIGSVINTYFDKDDYELMLIDLEKILND